MGLLAKISASDFSQKSSKKANFCTFLEDNSIHYLALLSPYGDSYFCTKTFGFDINSMIKTWSTKTFWDGLFSSGEKFLNFNKDDGSIIQLLQFFSDAQKDLIESASLYSFEDGAVLAVFNTKLNENLVNEFSSAKDNLPHSSAQKILAEGERTYSFSIDFTESVEYFVSLAKRNTGVEVSDLEKLLMNELTERLYFTFSASNFIYRISDFCASVKMTAAGNLPEEMIFHHIVKVFSEVLGSASELIQLNFGE